MYIHPKSQDARSNTRVDNEWLLRTKIDHDKFVLRAAMFLLPHGHKISKQSFGLAEFLTKNVAFPPGNVTFLQTV